MIYGEPQQNIVLLSELLKVFVGRRPELFEKFMLLKSTLCVISMRFMADSLLLNIFRNSCDFSSPAQGWRLMRKTPDTSHPR